MEFTKASLVFFLGKEPKTKRPKTRHIIKGEKNTKQRG